MFKSTAKRLKAAMASVWSELKMRVISMVKTCMNSVERFVEGDGGIIRIAIDLAIGIGVCVLSPIAAVGIASANFCDDIDSFGSVVSLAVAFAVLEVVALWSLEIIAVLVAMQFARISVRYVQNYKLRRDAELKKPLLQNKLAA